MHIDPSFRRRDGVGAIEEAIRVFFHRLSTTSLPRISIQLGYFTGIGSTRYLTEVNDLVTSYALLEPRAEWKVFDDSWLFESGFATTYTGFVDTAKAMKQALAKFDATIQLRR